MKKRDGEDSIPSQKRVLILTIVLSVIQRGTFFGEYQQFATNAKANNDSVYYTKYSFKVNRTVNKNFF